MIEGGRALFDLSWWPKIAQMTDLQHLAQLFFLPDIVNSREGLLSYYTGLLSERKLVSCVLKTLNFPFLSCHPVGFSYVVAL